ncbi:UDP-N-acetylmuramoyl-tripeptide--D-alanyl-D-alanine ligase [Enterobacteriaceae endosymbiont of Neohaemonia nigricornis]|uniref:UDP-N-acetylmuramoyl-tripeptide--D-alanyl-D- alanine ligase n=1 Tax=Enterobacteriaceae endosymbiont of Neohaemonia nigricornis TaxID=2675792 RepID=UPI00144A0C90|nr:UDP-N-acetylmuramoyl-tripeptide--D-alanyl-D-alanine ligase [Enterobacteriaceae endosymbiont of Neohaemonia nigricornis]QJC30340.1 UDP-N-acetylmuramoyl-tripeptide--D-alanyl-D-alanine ligase [Enterobacteriaceae endosymbiont of Neohaemonia nigricornis]
MLTNLTQIADITNGILIGDNTSIRSYSINSKIIYNNCMFIAICGKKFDGHNYINEAIKNGAQALLVQQYIRTIIPQIIVNDTIFSLGLISAWKRSQFKNTVIGITGTSGKTSVKEMTVSILQRIKKTIYTIDNMNNHIGVPLTLLNLNNTYKYAVIEIGANNLYDISYISNIVKPNIAIINNISIAHLEGFKNLNNIIKSKIQIFNYLKNNGTIIINYDDDHQKNILHTIKHNNILTFSINNKNTDFFTSNIQINTDKIEFNLHTPIGIQLINLFIIGGIHNIQNALASAVIAFTMGITLEDIANGLKYFKPIQGRMYPIFVSKNKLILNDAYNANPNSVIQAINILQKITGPKLLIIGDMMELGTKTLFYHEYIGKKLSGTNINFIFSIGNYSKYITKNISNAKHFLSSQDLITQLFITIQNLQHYTILFKGSYHSHIGKLIKIFLEKLKC